MQRVTVVRYTVKTNHADENESLARAVFAELKVNAPRHISYALFRNGSDFAHVFINSHQDDASELVDLPAFKAFQQGIAGRCVAPPEVLRVAANMLEYVGLSAHR
jgi:hypothetical protein